MIKRALISVSDKTGLIPLVTRLVACGFEIVSTSGTAKAIKEAGLPCTMVEDVTGFPEMLNGRVRTLHPNIFGGIIADQGDPGHMRTLSVHNIAAFGLVIVNLYPFESNPTIENIDVGGPSMFRAAAKNYESMAVITSPDQYDSVLLQIEANGEVDEKTRLKLAYEVFDRSRRYEESIAEEFHRCIRDGTKPARGAKH
jgi:phosphoribosylaminoimidazolecarboxamide formyltransferase/IMP cyclohydrolase